MTGNNLLFQIILMAHNHDNYYLYQSRKTQHSYKIFQFEYEFTAGEGLTAQQLHQIFIIRETAEFVFRVTGD